MKNLVFAVALALVAATSAQAGDAGAGATAYATKGCIGCHGASGKAPIAANYPVIGGKPADFIATELNKFRSGERQDPTMSAMAQMLNDADVANVAAYLASQ